MSKDKDNNHLVLRPDDLKQCGDVYIAERLLFTSLVTMFIFIIAKLSKMKTIVAIVLSIIVFFITFYIFSLARFCSSMNYRPKIAPLLGSSLPCIQIDRKKDEKEDCDGEKDVTEHYRMIYDLDKRNIAKITKK